MLLALGDNRQRTQRQTRIITAFFLSFIAHLVLCIFLCMQQRRTALQEKKITPPTQDILVSFQEPPQIPEPGMQKSAPEITNPPAFSEPQAVKEDEPPQEVATSEIKTEEITPENAQLPTTQQLALEIDVPAQKTQIFLPKKQKTLRKITPHKTHMAEITQNYLRKNSHNTGQKQIKKNVFTTTREIMQSWAHQEHLKTEHERRPKPVTGFEKPWELRSSKFTESDRYHMARADYEDKVYKKAEKNWFSLFRSRFLEEDHQPRHLLIEVIIDRLGNLASFTVLRSSGDPRIDKAMHECYKKASPFLAPPKGLLDNGKYTSIRGIRIT